MFNDSHDFVIRGGAFHNAGRDLNIFQEGERGLLTLHRYTSTSALYNAEARFPPPLCHPGTRIAVLEDLDRWMKSGESHDFKIGWLYGAAGAGKSAIAQTFAEACAKNATLAGTFFFWRSDPSRNNHLQLFTTVAFEIAHAVPELHDIINSAVEKNPSVLTSSMETQFDKLILQPWLQTLQGEDERRDSSLIKNRVLIIDGLDECAGSDHQQRIISILASAMQKHALPLRILIASRPEPRIKESFADPHLGNICRWIPLNSTYEASRDIRVFLQDRFKNILARHSHSMSHIPRPWPSSEQIEYLVHKASGHFVYASTVLKYVNEDGAVPADRLNIVLGICTPEVIVDQPFAELDALYHQILSTVKNPVLVRQILGALIVFQEQKHFSATSQVKFIDILPYPLGVLQASFAGLHSLFSDPSPVQSDFQFCHASFQEFLLDRKRSLHFFIDKAEAHDNLACRYLDIIVSTVLSRQAVEDRGNARDPALATLFYADKRWLYHSAYAGGGNSLTAKLACLNIYAFLSRQVTGIYWRGLGPEKLARLLVQVTQIWTRYQVGYERYLKYFRDVSTAGFTLVLADRCNRSIGYYTIPIPLSPECYSAVGNGSTPTWQRLRAHMISVARLNLMDYGPFTSLSIDSVMPLQDSPSAPFFRERDS